MHSKIAKLRIGEIEKQKGISLFGFLVVVSIFVSIAFIALKIYPIYSEKINVDMAIETLKSQPGVSQMTTPSIAGHIEKQLSMNYVTSLSRKDIMKALKVKNTRDGKKVSFTYLIEQNMFEKWKLIYSYNNAVLISGNSKID